MTLQNIIYIYQVSLTVPGCIATQDEEHFSLFCRKYTNLRITLFNKLNLKIPILKPNTNECFKLLYELMKPSSSVNTKLICGKCNS